jgi:hypothetical protein
VNEPAYIAIIFAGDGSVAGTGFSIREGFLITCAHVVRDALGLGPATPDQRPGKAVSVRFPYYEGKPEVSATVVSGGWFPGHGSDMSLDDLKDIAILGPEDKQMRFPVGPPLMPLRWDGKAACFGFPATRKGGYRQIKGEVDPIAETDGWLNYRTLNAGEKAMLGGMSGGAVRHDNFEGIAGMLSSHRVDDEFILRIVPGSTLVRAVEQAKEAQRGKPEGGSLYLQDSKDRATRAVIKGWQQHAGPSSPLPAADEIASLTQKLLEVAHPRANQLPENFPYRYLELRLGLLLRLTEERWPPAVERLGDFIANLAEFVADLSMLPWEMREQIAACMDIGRGLGAQLPAGTCPDLKGHDAEWPPGLAKDIREKVQHLQDAVAPIRGDDPSKDQAAAVDYNAASIEAETYRPRPNWGQMSNQAAEIVSTVANLQRQIPSLMWWTPHGRC